MSRHSGPLHLHEEVLLLALRDEKGTVAPGTQCSFALGGAILAELLLEGRLAVTEGKKPFVEVVENRALGDPILDECLDKVRTAKRRAVTRDWVSRFAHAKGLRNRIAQGLCRAGILRADEDRILGLFRRKIFPEIDPRPERELLERLRRAIFTESRDVDTRTVVLLALAHAAGLLNIPFEKKRLRERKRRIESLVNGEAAGAATREAIDAAIAVQAAMTVILTTTTVIH